MLESSFVIPRPFVWSLFFMVWGSTVLGSVMVLPYALKIQRGQLESSGTRLNYGQLIGIQIGQSMIMFAILGSLGLLLASKIGLGFVFLEPALLGKPRWAEFPPVLTISLVSGLFTGIIIVLLDLWIFTHLLKIRGIDLPKLDHPTPLEGFLASFYGGVVEEVMLRLFLLTLFAWLGMLLFSDMSNAPTLATLWSANVIASVVFGIGHLPGAKVAGMPLSKLVVLRVISLNALGGLIFGWLYISRGIEAAMIAHFTADIVLHVIIEPFKDYREKSKFPIETVVNH